MTLPDYPERAAYQYAVVRNVCYPEQPPADVSTAFERVSGYGTRLETDGRRLTKVNIDTFHEEVDAEVLLAGIAHEAAHTGHGGRYGRGVASHPPAFWEEYARVCSVLLADDAAWAAVNTMFERDLDRHRFRYRLLQDFTTNQIDKRQQSADGCKMTFATNIGFDTYGRFDDVYVQFGQEGVTYFDGDPYSVRLDGFSETARPAVGLTDDELYAVAERVGTEDDHGNLLVPAPLVTIPEGDAVLTDPNGDAVRDDAWRRASAGDVQFLDPQDSEDVRLSLALQDRVLGECWVTDSRLLDDGVDPVLGYGTDWGDDTGVSGRERTGTPLQTVG
jgi:hypothetical protein